MRTHSGGPAAVAPAPGPAARKTQGGDRELHEDFTSLFVPVDVFAKRLHVSPNHVLAEIQRGHIPHVRLGKRVLVCWPYWVLRALGVDDLPQFLKDMGIHSASELLTWLEDPDGEGEL